MKKILYTIIFFVISIYTFKSVSFIVNYNQQIEILNDSYNDLKLQKKVMEYEMQLLKNKISGLKENSINLDVLENQLKSNLNYYKKKEIIILE